MREIAETLKIDYGTVQRHLQQLGYVSRLDVWVPHKLTEENLANRMSICNSLLKRHESDPFLKRIVTGDEKWSIYDNIVRKRSWGTTGKPPKCHPEGRPASEDFVIHMVGSSWCAVLRAASSGKND